MNEADERKLVVQEALSWLRTPYHHMQRVKGAGVDCGQFLIAVYSATGVIRDIDTGYYAQQWASNQREERYLKWIERYACRVDVPLPGDIVVYLFGRCMSHGGVVVEWPSIVHSYVKLGCLLDHGDKGNLEGRYHRFYSPWRKN